MGRRFIYVKNNISTPIGLTRIVFTGTTTWTVPEGVTTAKVLVVGGGGGGGRERGGGGGGGGVVYNSGYTLTPSDVISVIIGTGGSSATGVAEGTNGTYSSFDDDSASRIKAYGGGGGGKYQGNGQDGACGGGTGRDTSTAVGGSASPPNQGFRGGKAIATTFASAGGGGGAGGAGNDGNRDNSNYASPYSDGGVGADYSLIFGTDVGEDGFFAGGGAGGWQSTGGVALPPKGGKGGGGDYSPITGLCTGTAAQQNGMANTGGGGAGVCVGPIVYGGSGVVIIIY